MAIVVVVLEFCEFLVCVCVFFSVVLLAIVDWDVGFLCVCFWLSGLAGGSNGSRKREIGRERKNRK